ncbi:hypothetical protein [Bradyrhizobium sp. WD16]|uniref:hypothetical protein n=1 Tax=Bradyrhizobium sp. WD16 TaxID=1521768 RepID=UPI0020A57781|nr:hypothetical protein [Bradyrhizobium sp. WD16]
MIVSHPRARSVGRVAALAAAYAFVLQLMLASSLLAGLSPTTADALHDLCFGASSAPSDPAGSGKAKPVLHCPLCVSRADAVLSPAEPPALPQRIAVNVPSLPPTPDAAIAIEAATGHRARAPPASA